VDGGTDGGADGGADGGGRRGLTRTAIVTAALRLIDESGPSGFSMRRLGRALGVDPSALYWHLKGQDELFQAVAETLVSEVDLTTLPWDRSWQQFAEEYAVRLHAVLLRHPNAVVLFATRSVTSPDAVRAADHWVTGMVAAGFTPAESVRAAFALRAFTVGAALDAAARSLAEVPAAPPAGPPPADTALARGVSGAGDYFRSGLAAMIRGLRPDT